VFTTEDPEKISVVHPRLTVARPAPSWGVERLPRFAQALIQFRPEVIHTFALKPTRLWPKLTLWPYLEALCQVLPGVRRVSTFFDAEDFTALDWHRAADRWTVFSTAASEIARAHFAGPIEHVPVDEVLATESSAHEGERGFLFVPAPVSEWPEPEVQLLRLAETLHRNPEMKAWINGGWGDWGTSQRRQGWQRLSSVRERVRLIEAQSLSGLVERTRACSALWMESMRPESWRALLTSRLAQQFGRELIGGEAPVLRAGSTANSLSRLYLT
jgi:hypothetical protein